ncbi:MAG TPA: hypothetical protein VFT72_19950 [Opitutaceae bacterium]|nr:hypothetical protein [Opitutaceae bacterium]
MMKNARFLGVMMFVFIASGLAIILLARRVPLPFRIAAASIDFLAALGIGTLLRQRKNEEGRMKNGQKAAGISKTEGDN